VRIYQGLGQEPKEIDLDGDMAQVISQMIGKRAGNVEKIFIDLKRSEVQIQNALEALIRGEPIRRNEAVQSGPLMLERLKMDGEDLIHVSKANRSLYQINQKAEIYSQAIGYFTRDIRKHIPVGIEVGLFEGMDQKDLEDFLRKYQSDLAIIGEERKVSNFLRQFVQYQEKLQTNRVRYDQLEEDHKMLVVKEGSELQVPGSSVLKIKEKSLGVQTYHVVDLARFVANIGKSQAKSDPKANQLLKELLRTMYEAGEIPQELLEEMPLAKILENPEGFLLPPIKSNIVNDIDSYLRAKNAVASMA
jgi:hypothetical protein